MPFDQSLAVELGRSVRLRVRYNDEPAQSYDFSSAEVAHEGKSRDTWVSRLRRRYEDWARRNSLVDWVYTIVHMAGTVVLGIVLYGQFHAALRRRRDGQGFGWVLGAGYFVYFGFLLFMVRSSTNLASTIAYCAPLLCIGLLPLFLDPDTSPGALAAGGFAWALGGLLAGPLATAAAIPFIWLDWEVQHVAIELLCGTNYSCSAWLLTLLPAACGLLYGWLRQTYWSRPNP